MIGYNTDRVPPRLAISRPGTTLWFIISTLHLPALENRKTSATRKSGDLAPCWCPLWNTRDMTRALLFTIGDATKSFHRR